MAYLFRQYVVAAETKTVTSCQRGKDDLDVWREAQAEGKKASADDFIR
ncbi:MAG: hypothetical protein HYV60_22915 [Planctomycetia bacterium]|nr:hypothetical protein [Planctomycetia bacterium]